MTANWAQAGRKIERLVRRGWSFKLQGPEKGMYLCIFTSGKEQDTFSSASCLIPEEAVMKAAEHAEAK